MGRNLGLGANQVEVGEDCRCLALGLALHLAETLRGLGLALPHCELADDPCHLNLLTSSIHECRQESASFQREPDWGIEDHFDRLLSVRLRLGHTPMVADRRVPSQCRPSVNGAALEWGTTWEQ